jgi:alpha-beta hydrolase superfamily lysophospholipase
MLGHVQHPQHYRETIIPTSGAPIALSVWDAGAASATVVFVPGTGVHPLFYEEFLDALWGSGYTVVGVHPQGHGKSPRVPRPLRWANLVDNAVDACAWAVDQRAARVVLLGSSQGGLVALLAAAAGAPVTGVIAHNVFDPNDPDAVMVTRLGAARAAQRPSRRLLAAAAAVAPRVPVPITAYLDPERVFGTPWTRELFELDPLSLRSYPLRFLADMVTADTTSLYDGSLTVPVVVLAARRDPLFPLVGIQAVTRRLVAPSVELVVLDTACHLILNEALDLSVPAVLQALADLVAAEPAPVGTGPERTSHA